MDATIGAFSSAEDKEFSAENDAHVGHYMSPRGIGPAEAKQDDIQQNGIAACVGKCGRAFSATADKELMSVDE